MKATDIWKTGHKSTVSFELFPPRSAKSAEKFENTIDELVTLKPDFVSVTFGAGGSTRGGSRQLIEKLKNEKGQEVIAYFAGYGLEPDDIISVLDSYQALGIDNILVVRGDKPQDQEDFQPHPQSLPHASDLMEFIRPRYDFCIGVAGYPEGHIEAESKEKDIEYLKLKINNGAQYIISNYFYDNRYYFDFVERCRTASINVPILAGLMPVYSIKMMEMLAGLCGATITDELRQGIEKLPVDDKDALVNFGIEFAICQCKDLLKAGVPGLHIYTMDRGISSVAIVERLRIEGLL
ncbi:MAG: 5,10-methylenetetrahydrofolate reductase [Planctomycetes bacterium]|nr:5,10-methylenetetrahydrofolate reductase [Planctomycetota bacterium]